MNGGRACSKEEGQAALKEGSRACRQCENMQHEGSYGNMEVGATGKQV